MQQSECPQAYPLLNTVQQTVLLACSFTSLLCVGRRHEPATSMFFEDDLHDCPGLVVKVALYLHGRQQPVWIFLLVLVGFDLFQILQQPSGLWISFTL